MATKQSWERRRVRFGGFSLSVEGDAQLNYHVLRQNTLDELQRPLDQLRMTRVTQSHTIHRDAKNYTLERPPLHKEYRLVYSKRVLDPHTAKTYPYGYKRLTEDDLDLLEQVMSL